LRCVRSRLANGVRVLLVPLPNLHSATVAVYARSGPRFEQVQLNGISHFIEHLLFRGTRRYPDSAALSRAADAMGADLNGATYPEYTELTLSLHHKHLAPGLELLGELVSHPRFRTDDICKERRVVQEEMAQQRDAGGANVNLDELSLQLMWPRQKFRFSTMGARPALRRFTRRRVLAYYRRMFSPTNLVVCMAGRLQVRRALRLARQQFGELTAAPPLRGHPIVDAQRRSRLAIRKHLSPVAHFRLGHKACSYRDPHLTRVLLLCDILGGGTSSRLFVNLREQLGLVYDVSAGPVLFSDVGAVEISTSTTRARTAATVKALLQQIDQFLKDGVSEAELRTVKDRVANHMELMLDSAGELVEWFGVRELLTSPAAPETPASQMQKALATSRAAIMQTAREVFDPSRRSLLVLGSVGQRQERQIRSLLHG